MQNPTMSVSFACREPVNVQHFFFSVKLRTQGSAYFPVALDRGDFSPRGSLNSFRCRSCRRRQNKNCTRPTPQAVPSGGDDDARVLKPSCKSSYWRCSDPEPKLSLQHVAARVVFLGPGPGFSRLMCTRVG